MQSIFQQLDHFLLENQKFWRFEPFHQSMQEASPWSEKFPQLENWLDELTFSDIESLKDHSSVLNETLAEYVPGLAKLLALVQLPSHSAAAMPRNIRLEVGISGRKLKQIQSISYHLLRRNKGKEWLEWCSGKGYLGRMLSYHSGRPVVSFEFQKSLCESGQSDADRLSLPMTFVQGDAFEAASYQHFHSNQHAVALHACGDLHVRLMQYATKARCRAISFSPCCYHLINSDDYLPLSRLGMASILKLNRNELRIPLQETVTGGERVKRHRQLEMSFRLGFDELLRKELGHSEYCPVPSVKKSQLSEGFLAFCRWAAEQKGITLSKFDADFYERIGVERFWKMERLSLVQQGFRRLLEMWLVMDKAMYLSEQGYVVALSEFCERGVTPRNVLVHAYRREETKTPS